MDFEKLILLVQERKHLWDQMESNYHMQNFTKIVEEVSLEPNEPGKFCLTINFLQLLYYFLHLHYYFFMLNN